MRHSQIQWRRVCVGAAAAVLLSVPVAAGSAYGVTAPLAPSPSATASSSPSASSDAGFAQLDPAVAARLDTAVKQVMREANVPGVSVSLSAPGKGNYVRSFGVADKATGTPMTPNLYMRIGSETKTFTVTAMLELVDQGKLGLDDPIGKYIPGVPNGDKITLRQLAEMRSGLFNYSEDSAFGKAMLSDPKKPFTPRQLLDYSFKHPVLFQPGKEFLYCNTNLILLGLVIEKVSGQPLNEYIAQKVLKPAGLTHTSFPTDAAFPSPHAQGYTNQTLSGKVEVTTDWNPSWAWAAGAMISDLSDLKSWAHTVATGTLLSAKTQAERLKTIPSTIPGAGYGVGIFNIQGWIGHNGSLPGYESLTVYLPEAKATLVVLINTDMLHGKSEPTTLFGQAITKIVTPGHVFNIPVVEPHVSPAPSTSSSPSP
ncbi:D-alanyl-D-alanine carboxypeptidase [Streptomyces hundungensis]|uniref:D-alanyl-D-alanine carboxypeptidase n=1 Tax=Streptomyces hundungensis TaxID=1077946 RepID=A0A387HF44_9ACTN|nr:serine hydrolase domain-containing protein [Streptomyces hundungensis]AYG79392.1 D-alanyl-D-alanine carboxypeptidase [Streptomyces hundungensis]